MIEFVQAILSPINLVLAALLGLCVVYWLVVIVFGLTAEALDAVCDFLECGADADANAGGDFDGPGGKFGLGLIGSRLLNLGRVPVAVVFTSLAFSMWAISVVTYHWQRDWSFGWRLAALVPVFFGAVALTKALTWPVARLFSSLRDDERSRESDLTGQRCRVVSSEVTAEAGQAEFATRGAPLLLNVRTEGGAMLRRGDVAVIVRRDVGRGVFLVKSPESKE